MNKPEMPEDIKIRLADEVALFIVENNIPIDKVIDFTTKISRIVSDAHFQMTERIIDDLIHRTKG